MSTLGEFWQSAAMTSAPLGRRPAGEPAEGRNVKVNWETSSVTGILSMTHDPQRVQELFLLIVELPVDEARFLVNPPMNSR